MPRKDSETLPAIFLTNSPKHDDDPSQFTTSTSPKPAQKPKIAPLPPSSDLLSRLNAFLPAISAANQDLESEIAAGTIASRNIENVDAKSDAYIEMTSSSSQAELTLDAYLQNLGLGVLKQLDPNNPSESESEDEDVSEGKGGDDDILGKLLQRSAQGSKPGIQEIEQDQATDTTKPKPTDDMEIGPLEKR